MNAEKEDKKEDKKDSLEWDNSRRNCKLYTREFFRLPFDEPKNKKIKS